MSCHCALRARRNFLLIIYYSFCCSKSLVAIISSIWPNFLVKTPNTETPNAGASKGQHSEGWKHRKVMTPVTQAWDRILYHTAVVSCHTDISYRADTSYNIVMGVYDIKTKYIRLIYFVLISYTPITIIHHPGIISHYADIMPCCYIVLYHIIWYGYFNCWYNIIHIYRSHGNNLCYQNWYYLEIKRLPLNWKLWNLLLRLECIYTSIPLHSSNYLSSQECYFRLLTVVWLLSVLTLQCFDHSVFFYP